jgi:hypothetical protein
MQLSYAIESAVCKKSEQRLICGIHDWITRGRVGVKWPWINRFIRIIMLIRLPRAIRALLKIIFCHEASHEVIR